MYIPVFRGFFKPRCKVPQQGFFWSTEGIISARWEVTASIVCLSLYKDGIKKQDTNTYTSYTTRALSQNCHCLHCQIGKIVYRTYQAKQLTFIYQAAMPKPVNLKAG
jgi:hypothetical protein